MKTVPLIKRCPFCRGHADIIVRNVDEQNYWMVQCGRKSCMAVIYGRSISSVCRRWNRRAANSQNVKSADTAMSANDSLFTLDSAAHGGCPSATCSAVQVLRSEARSMGGVEK